MSGTKGFLRRFKDTFRSSSDSNTSSVTDRGTLPSEDELNDPPIEIKRRVSRSRSGRIKQFTRSRSMIYDYTFQPINDDEFNKKPQDGCSGGEESSNKSIQDKEIKRTEKVKSWSISTEKVDTKDLEF